MRKWIIIFACLAAALFLTACDEEIQEIDEVVETVEKDKRKIQADIFPLNFEYAMDAGIRRREAITKPDYTILLAMIEGHTPMPNHPVGFWNPPDNPPHRVATAAAVVDVWSLVALMRDVYGGYMYFGGDEVFSAMLTHIVQELFAIDDHSILTSDFLDILYRHLSEIIVDNHLRLDDRRLGADVAFYHGHGLAYDRSDNGFRCRVTGMYLMEIEGHVPEEVMRLHVDGMGRMSYSPVVLLPRSLFTSNIYMTYEDGKRRSRTFFKEVIPGQREVQLPSLKFINDIPVVTVMSMGFDGHENAWRLNHAAPFLEFAEQLRDEPVVIVDIRGNRGGNVLLSTRWLYALTGELVPFNYVALTTQPPNSAVFRFNPNNIFQNPPGAWETYISLKPFGDGYTISGNEPRKIIEREQKLIVLTDRNTVSAAEGFVDSIFNVTNTLVIGTPTGGMLAFDTAYANMYLPNTGIPLGLGRTKMLWPEDHFAESVGIMPDVWVAGDALAAALALVNNAD